MLSSMMVGLRRKQCSSVHALIPLTNIHIDVEHPLANAVPFSG